MVEPETLWGRAQDVAERLRRSAVYLPGLRDYAPDGPLLERLSPDEAHASTRQGHIVAAWRTTRIHVSARVVAERLTAAVRARGISVLTGTVTSIESDTAGWRIHVGGQGSIDTDVVVNCTWEWRAALDRSIQANPGPVSIRYKRAMFATGALGFAAVEPVHADRRTLRRYRDLWERRRIPELVPRRARSPVGRRRPPACPCAGSEADDRGHPRRVAASALDDRGSRRDLGGPGWLCRRPRSWRYRSTR